MFQNIKFLILFLINFKVIIGNQNGFVLIKNNYEPNEDFRKNYTINSIIQISLIKCSVRCSLNKNCFLFSFMRNKTNTTCEMFSNDTLSDKDIIQTFSSKIYKLKLKTKQNVLITTTTISTTTTQIDYICVNQVCTCYDTSRLLKFSLFQIKKI